MEYFMVSAETSNPNVFYDSNVDSGYSVDNLPPLPPQNVVASVSVGKVNLQWSANTERDLKDYLVYRSQSSIADSSKIAPYDTTLDTSYVDAHPLAGQKAYYVIRAEDIHGNISKVSNEVSVIATGVDERSGIPREYNLWQNYPNPFNPTTTINYELPTNSHVTLMVYDALGREVATLVDENKTAGSYNAAFDGSRYASGVYFYKLSAGTFTQIKKMILLK
jgi:fibronectin type 3 domain-containing protein